MILMTGAGGFYPFVLAKKSTRSRGALDFLEHGNR